MEEIQLIGSLSHYLQGFTHPRWCRISSISSITLYPKRLLSLLGYPAWGIFRVEFKTTYEVHRGKKTATVFWKPRKPTLSQRCTCLIQEVEHPSWFSKDLYESFPIWFCEGFERYTFRLTMRLSSCEACHNCERNPGLGAVGKGQLTIYIGVFEGCVETTLTTPKLKE